MRFQHPSGFEFEVPDEWLAEAGLLRPAPERDHYSSGVQPTSVFLRIADIEPIRRRFEFDGGGFHHDRMVSILKGIVADDELPPIEVHELPSGPFRYGLRGGFHRFFASIAAGFEGIPVTILPYFVFET